MRPFELVYHSNAERPIAEGWIYDSDGNLVDLSTGFTFSLKVGTPGSAAVLTKSSGITGAVGAGTEPTGTPNLTISWTSGELNLAAGRYTVQITATSGGLDRDPWEGSLVIQPVIT